MTINICYNIEYSSSNPLFPLSYSIGGEDFEDEVEGCEEVGLHVFKSHPALLSKGFALSNAPTIHHALDGVIPFR